MKTQERYRGYIEPVTSVAVCGLFVKAKAVFGIVVLQQDLRLKLESFWG